MLTRRPKETEPHRRDFRRGAAAFPGDRPGGLGTMVSPRASIATSDAIFRARPAGVFMLFVRKVAGRLHAPRGGQAPRVFGFARGKSIALGCPRP